MTSLDYCSTNKWFKKRYSSTAPKKYIYSKSRLDPIRKKAEEILLSNQKGSIGKMDMQALHLEQMNSHHLHDNPIELILKNNKKGNAIQSQF